MEREEEKGELFEERVENRSSRRVAWNTMKRNSERVRVTVVSQESCSTFPPSVVNLSGLRLTAENVLANPDLSIKELNAN